MAKRDRGVLWSYDGDEDRWPALAASLSAEHLRLLHRNLSWARRQCAGAWSLMEGMVTVVEQEQQRRAAEEGEG